MRNLKLALSLIVLAFSGCATTGNYQRMVNTWVGQHVDDLIGRWGYPTREFEDRNGNKIVAYELAQNRRNPVYTTPATTHTSYQYYANNSQSVTIPGVQMGGNEYTAWCYTYFELDGNDVIIKWTHQGNACVY